MRKFVFKSPRLTEHNLETVPPATTNPTEPRTPPWIPESGFNVVSIDRDKPPGVDMFVLGHYATSDEADAARLRFEADGVECGVWGAFKTRKKKKTTAGD